VKAAKEYDAFREASRKYAVNPTWQNEQALVRLHREYEEARDRK
jgi:hypothetical protein